MSATVSQFMVRSTINTKRFARENPEPRRGRPTRSWVLVSGTKRLEVYNADKGGVVIEGDDAVATERKAYAKAQSVGKRMGLKLRAIPFSAAFYQC